MPATNPHPAGHVFDPALVGGREADAWVAYYRHDWLRLMVASVGLVRVGFGMGPWRTTAAAWHVFRANRHWSPYPDNDPDAARRSMERFYALVAATGGVSIDAAHAARLEVRWWHLHRERQHRRLADDRELEVALADLYAYAYGVPRDAVLEAARWRVRAMDLSDQWVADGCRRNDPLLWQERRALVRSYTALWNAAQAVRPAQLGEAAAGPGAADHGQDRGARVIESRCGVTGLAYTSSPCRASQNGFIRPPKFGG